MKATITHAGAFALIVSPTDLLLAIQSARLAGETLQDNLQVIALSAVTLADQHGNTTPLLDLMTSFPQGMRQQAMVKWLKVNTQWDFQPARAANGDKPAKAAKVHKSTRAISFTQVKHRDKAAKAMWYAPLQAKRKEATKFNLSDYTDKFVERVEKAIEAGEATTEQVQALGARMLALSNRLAGLESDASVDEASHEAIAAIPVAARIKTEATAAKARATH